MGRFLAKVGPGTIANGPGLKNAAEIDGKYLGRPTPEVLKVKIIFAKPKLKYPPDPAPNPGFSRKRANRTLPRDPLGEGGKEQIKKRP